MICDYLKWIVDPEYVNANVFTFLSVIASGLISWGISASYFRKGNRDNLKSSVLHPMRRLLDGTCSREKYKELLDLSKEYSSKYLSKKERVIVDELLGAYKSVYAYQYDWVCAESLFSYFKPEQVDHHQRNGSVLSLLVILVCTPPWTLLFSAYLLRQCPDCEHSWFSSAQSLSSLSSWLHRALVGQVM